MIKKCIKPVGVAVSILLLSGCAATSTLIQHSSLQSSTKMSSTIFLPPQETATKLVYVQVKNTSDQEINIQPMLIKDLQARGYAITTNINAASQVLQVNILQAGETTNANVSSSLSDGFGGAVAGAALGVGLSSNPWAGGAIGGVAGGLIAAGADAIVKDVMFSVTTDVQVSVRLAPGVTATQSVQSSLKQGTGTMSTTAYTSQTTMQQYQTRIVSYADQVNLKFNEAAPVLEQNIAKSIANIF